MIWRFYPLDSSTLQNMRGSQDAQNSSSNCPDPSPQTQVMRKTFKELWCSRVTVWRGLHTVCRGWQSANGKGRGMGICWRCRRVEGGCSIQGGSPRIILLSTMLAWGYWESGVLCYCDCILQEKYFSSTIHTHENVIFAFVKNNIKPCAPETIVRIRILY